MTMGELDARLERMRQHKFRAKMQLRGRDRAVVDLRGIVTVRKHAYELIAKQLAPAETVRPGRPACRARTTASHDGIWTSNRKRRRFEQRRSGGDEGTRTLNLDLAKVLRCQLRHVPGSPPILPATASGRPLGAGAARRRIDPRAPSNYP